MEESYAKAREELCHYRSGGLLPAERPAAFYTLAEPGAHGSARAMEESYAKAREELCHYRFGGLKAPL